MKNTLQIAMILAFITSCATEDESQKNQPEEIKQQYELSYLDYSFHNTSQPRKAIDLLDEKGETDSWLTIKNTLVAKALPGGIGLRMKSMPSTTSQALLSILAEQVTHYEFTQENCNQGKSKQKASWAVHSNHSSSEYYRVYPYCIEKNDSGKIEYLHLPGSATYDLINLYQQVMKETSYFRETQTSGISK